MAANEACLDMNVILRYLLNDHPEHGPRAKALFEAAECGGGLLKLAPHILCEVVYILEGEDYTRIEIHDALWDLIRIKGIEVQEEQVVLEALVDYRDKNVDLSDALLAAMARARGEKVWTFNGRHFARMNGQWEEPPATPVSQGNNQ